MQNVNFCVFQKRGLIIFDEVLEEVGVLKEEMDEKIRRMGRDNQLNIFNFVLLKKIFRKFEVFMNEHIEQELTIFLLIQK